MTKNELLGKPYTSLVLDELARAGVIDLSDPRIDDVRPLCDEIIGARILQDRDLRKDP